MAPTPLVSLPVPAGPVVLRPLTVDDAPVLAAYRSHPEVARLQDWQLPFTVDDATELVEAQAHLAGPTPGEWVQIGIESAGRLVGDLAVGLDPAGELAMLGYTLAPEHHGRGLASAAVAAIVDALFDEGGVHRIAATLDPANVASARLLERLGFRYEGRSPSAANVRGTWCDDDRYALLRDDRDAWRARPTTPATAVELVELTADNVHQVLRLQTHASQRRFVAPMPASFADIVAPGDHRGSPVVPWYRAISADGVLAGFVMVAEPSEHDPDPYLWRLLVDRTHQGRGIGTRAVHAVVERARAQGASGLVVSWVEGRGSPRPFYERLGFAPTGEVDEGETVARLVL